jgi:hypothetical protein
MAENTLRFAPQGCGNSCQTATSIEGLNRTCFCLTLDEGALRRNLETALGVRGLSSALVETHPHLFAPLPLFVSREHIARIERVISAVQVIVATALFRHAALAWAPDIALFDPGSPGGLLGYDFHLTTKGPQLIEINTNPGGALLNAVLGSAQRSCCAEATGLAMAPMGAEAIEEAMFEVFMAEWRMQRGDSPLKSLAIVDDTPQQQYLYPEFLLYRQLFSRHGIATTICDPRELARRDGRLWHGDQPIDFAYNRLTDFALQEPAQAALKLAYLARDIVVSPHPRAHALYADKRNLSLLSDEAFLRQTGAADDTISTLLDAVPRTEIMTAENRPAMWAKRRKLFFKPAASFGSKAVYRGDKVTKRVWDEMTKGIYVAQALVAPSERQMADAPAMTLKADVRIYAYAGSVKLVAARLYQGQTTNFRTPGGGFAPVFTELPG